MSRYRWFYGRLLSLFGRRGLAGLGCLAVATLFYVEAVVPVSASLDQAREEAAELSLQGRGKSGGVKAGLQDPGDRLETFYRFFPTAAGVPDLLDKLYSAASRRSVVLGQGEYRLVREPGRLARYQITLPVQASYPRLRGFIEDVLEGVPAAALESVSFKRETISTDTVDAQIRFVLYLGGA
jgi:hypothetical protein